MIILGLFALLVGYLVGPPILTTIGAILLVVGIILAILGRAGHPVGGRSWYF